MNCSRKCRIHVEDIRRRFQSSDHVVDTFGPIEGYRIA